MSIEIVDHDSAWQTAAKQAIADLTTALPGTFARIEHVGSTSVPGLAAKPIIDLMAAVVTLDDVTGDHEATLRQLGYEPADTGMPGRLFFFRQNEAGRRSHHLHVVPEDTWDTRNERLLRDHLLANPRAAAEYGALKQRLAADGQEGLDYTRAKTELIQRYVDAERAARGLPLVPVWEE